MNLRARLTLENLTGRSVVIDIPKDMLFEVTNPISSLQNMRVSRNYQVRLMPYERRTVEIECDCANPSFRLPSNTAIRVTPFYVKKKECVYTRCNSSS
jgi:hypothetical protein